MKKYYERVKSEIQIWIDDFTFKYGPERIELARNRLRVHEKNMKGECQFNPYTEPDSNWWQDVDS